jgi:hypothetical protein
MLAKIALTAALVLAALLMAAGSYVAVLSYPAWAATLYIVFGVRAGVALGEAMAAVWTRA